MALSHKLHRNNQLNEAAFTFCGCLNEHSEVQSPLFMQNECWHMVLTCETELLQSLQVKFSVQLLLPPSSLFICSVDSRYCQFKRSVALPPQSIHHGQAGWH